MSEENKNSEAVGVHPEMNDTSNRDSGHEPNQYSTQKELPSIADMIKTIKEAHSIVVPKTETPQKSHSREGERYVDITQYLHLPQSEAARALAVPSSTLSKRWKEAACNRKWPFRAVAKLDKEILTLLHNINYREGEKLSPDVEKQLGALLRKRYDETKSVIIRL